MSSPEPIMINRQGQSFGPYTLDQVTHYLQAGNLVPTDLAWNSSASAWVPLAQLSGVKEVLPQLSLPRSRNVLLLIVMAVVWWVVIFIVLFISLCLVSGILTAIVIHPADPKKFGQMIGAYAAFPLFLGSIGLAIWLTIAGKLPGTRK